jgi:hypothetical protein
LLLAWFGAIGVVVVQPNLPNRHNARVFGFALNRCQRRRIGFSRRMRMDPHRPVQEG